MTSLPPARRQLSVFVLLVGTVCGAHTGAVWTAFPCLGDSPPSASPSCSRGWSDPAAQDFSHGEGGLCAAHDRSRWLHAALRPRKRLVGLGLSFNRSQWYYRPSLGTWSVVWRSPEALPPDPYPWRPAGPEQVVGAQ